MGNGRSFTRNRKGSPGKSRRKNLQRIRAAQRAAINVDTAAKRAIESMQAAFEEALPKMIDEFVGATGVSPEQAEDALRQAVNAEMQNPPAEEEETDV